MWSKASAKKWEDSRRKGGNFRSISLASPGQGVNLVGSIYKKQMWRSPVKSKVRDDGSSLSTGLLSIPCSGLRRIRHIGRLGEKKVNKQKCKEGYCAQTVRSSDFRKRFGASGVGTSGAIRSAYQ